MLALLRQRNIGLLWFAGLISYVGDWMLQVALPIYIFQITNSVLATGVMFMVAALPDVLLGSLAGVFVDRWDRKRTMVVANLLLAVTLLPVLLVRSTDQLWIVYLIALTQSCISQFFGPAARALLPSLVRDDQLLEVNTLSSLNHDLARLIGPVLGGLAAGTLGLLSVALLDAFSFLLAAGMIALITVDARRKPAHEAPADPGVARSWRMVWHEWLEGLRLVRKDRRITILFVVIATMAFGGGFFPVLASPFVVNVLHGDSQTFGWLMSAHAVGGLIGGVVLPRLRRSFPTFQLLGWGDILFGSIGILIFNAPIFAPQSGLTIAIILMFISGIPSVSALTSVVTLLQTYTSDAYRGRIFGAYSATYALLGLAGMALASVLGSMIGTALSLSLHGCLYILAGVIALLFLGTAHERVVPFVPLQSDTNNMG